jgi:hypothetical protein
MKKITLLFALLIFAFTNGQTTSSPVYDGVFAGSIYSQAFNFPTGAEGYAGFANNNTEIYPLAFTNGGKVKFKATVATDAEVYFRFEANPYPNVDPSYNTVNVTLLASNGANAEYEVAIPATTDTYNSALFYVVTRDVDVSMSEIKIEAYDTDGTTLVSTDFPVYDGVFAGSVYSQTFNFPTGAEGYAGFANNNTEIYPLAFTSGGKVTFKATVAADAEVYFRFEANPYPNVDPSYNTVNVTLLASNGANTEYEVAIPATTDTYNSALFYVVTRDVDVSMSEIKIVENENSVDPTPTVLQDFTNLTNTATADVYGGFGGGLTATNAIVDDPVDASNKVRTVTTTAGGDTWKGVFFRPQTHYIDLTSTKTVSLKVYSTTATYFKGIIQAGQSGQATIELETSEAHTGDGWETLTFTFPTATGEWGELALRTNVDANGTLIDPAVEVLEAHFDDLTAAQGSEIPAPASGPTDAPTTPPTFDANNVISLYSDAYTAATTINNVSWDDSAFEEVSIAGNNVLKISGTNFLGIDLGAYLDATNMTHLHMDYWIATDWSEGQVLNPKLSNHVGEDGETNALDITNIINSQTEVQNWQSKDFVLNGDRESIKQFLITVAGKTGLYYLDNVYLYVDGTAGLEDNNIINVSVYPNPSNTNWNFRTGNTVITSVEVFNLLGKRVVLQNNNSTNVAISTQGLTSGIYIARITTEQGTKSVKLIKE